MNRKPYLKSAFHILLIGGILGSASVVRSASTSAELARQLNEAFIDVAERVSSSVVVLSVAHKLDVETMEEGSPFWDWLPPQMRKQLEERQKKDSTKLPRNHPRVFDGQGSGVIVREDGYILTNGHVVKNAEKIRVRLKNRKVYDAEVKGIDALSDLAVVKIDAKGLPVAKFADPQKIRVGEFAIAVGAPFDLDYSITFGHVSAKGRSGIILDPAMDQDFIQTDASINPGNSGGPLVNIEGEVIGINTLIRGMNTGIGFAIPCGMAREVGEALMQEGKFVRAWLGLEIRALREDTDIQGMVKGVEDGVVVRGIRKDGPAANSELKLGDVITAVDGRPVGTSQMLRNEVRTKKVGSTVVLDVARKDKTLKVKVKTDAWPEEQVAEFKNPAEASETTNEDFGYSVKPITKDLAKEYGVEMVEGMLVTNLEDGGLAQRKGIQKGDIITEMNQNSTKTLREYKAALKECDLKKGILITLVSQGVSKLIVLKDTGD